MGTVLKVAAGVTLGLLVVLGIGAVIVFGVLGVEDVRVSDSPPASEAQAPGDDGVSDAALGLRLARANVAISRYCVKAIGYPIGAEEAPSNRATRKALDGVDMLEAAALEDPDRKLAKGDTVRELVEMAISSARNGRCLDQEAERLEAALA